MTPAVTNAIMRSVFPLSETRVNEPAPCLTIWTTLSTYWDPLLPLVTLQPPAAGLNKGDSEGPCGSGASAGAAG